MRNDDETEVFMKRLEAFATSTMLSVLPLMGDDFEGIEDSIWWILGLGAVALIAAIAWWLMKRRKDDDDDDLEDVEGADADEERDEDDTVVDDDDDGKDEFDDIEFE
jgi:LPXTG-motif cell wall-anchored protein